MSGIKKNVRYSILSVCYLDVDNVTDCWLDDEVEEVKADILETGSSKSSQSRHRINHRRRIKWDQHDQHSVPAKNEK